MLEITDIATGLKLVTPEGGNVRLPDGRFVTRIQADDTIPGVTIAAYEPPEPESVSPTGDDVNAERDRRLLLPFGFNGVEFQRDEAATKRINGAGTLALAAIVGGAQPGDLRWHGEDTDFVWIAADNSLVPMDAQTVMAFGQAAAKVETALVFAAKAIKEMDPIPADYTDDSYWP